MKEHGQIQKIGEGAYFVIDLLQFTSTIQAYDPLIANQTICFSSQSPPPHEAFEQDDHLVPMQD